MTPFDTHAALIIAAAAICTVFTRALPFLFFGGSRGIPGPIRYLGKILPPAILAVLVVYCLKNISLLQAPFGAPELLASALTVILHVWKRNNLLSIAGGTICYMLLVQVVFA